MTPTVAGVGLFALLAVLPLPAGRRGVSPRVAAGAHLVTLVGWGLLPVVWLACLGGSVGPWVGGIRVPGGGCLLGLDHGQWQLLGYLPAAVVLGVVVWHGLLLATAARRAEMRGAALGGSVRRLTSTGEVWVVPSSRPVAVAAGLWRSRAVVSSGLLAPLREAERQAVCEHEAAHVRLGHPRLLIVGGAVAALYGRFAPVRRAWDGLRRELEAAADDEAVRVVGSEALLSALVQVALMVRAPTGGPAAAFGDAGHLRYRIARLEEPGPIQTWPTVIVGLSIGVAASSMAVVGCLLAGASATVLGAGACFGGIALIGLRPMWGWGYRSMPR